MVQYKTEAKSMFRLLEEQMDDVEMEWKAFKDGYFRKKVIRSVAEHRENPHMTNRRQNSLGGTKKLNKYKKKRGH